MRRCTRSARRCGLAYRESQGAAGALSDLPHASMTVRPGCRCESGGRYESNGVRSRRCVGTLTRVQCPPHCGARTVAVHANTAWCGPCLNVHAAVGVQSRLKACGDAIFKRVGRCVVGVCLLLSQLATARLIGCSRVSRVMCACVTLYCRVLRDRVCCVWFRVWFWVIRLGLQSSEKKKNVWFSIYRRPIRIGHLQTTTFSSYLQCLL